MNHNGCECTANCRVHSTNNCAPVAFLVERNGKQIKVCTRCKLSSDKVVRLLVDENTDPTPFFEYDVLGALTLWLVDNSN